MIRRLLSTILALGALTSPAAVMAQAKDELVVAMTQMPGTWNPIISSMLAKSLIANMTARPVTAYDADWKLVCLVCTELPTIANGKARVIDLADGKKGMEIDVELRYSVMRLQSYGSTSEVVTGRSDVETLSGYARWRAPTGVLLAIRGYGFDFAVGLTPAARRNLGLALGWLRGCTAR